jgi:hypothetical protein
MTPDGVIGNRTRSVLNGNEPAKPALSGSETQRLIANMERWRWLPEDMGSFHVWDNVPEFTARVLKNGQVVHTAKIVVGKVENQTPLFSASMRYIVFHPEWGVPDGIKLKEIAPYLRSGGGGFFGIFGSDTSVLQRHNLKVSMNGRPVDASSVNWDQVDIRSSNSPSRLGPPTLGIVTRFPTSMTSTCTTLRSASVQAERARVQPWLHAGREPRPPGRVAAGGGQAGWPRKCSRCRGGTTTRLS